MKRGHLTKKASANIFKALFSFLFIILATLLVIGSFLFPSKASVFRAQASSAIAPVITTLTHPLTELKNIIQNINDYRDLKENYVKIKSDNEKLTAWYLEAQSLQAENDALRQLQKVSNTSIIKKNKILTTTLLNDTSSDFAKSILIRAGTNDNVVTNSAVISAYGLVGRVVESSPSVARVMLVTDINARIPVIININGQLINAILAGQNNAMPLLTHIQEQSLRALLLKNDGAHVLTSGTGGTFPYGIPVGELHVAKNGSLRVNTYMKNGSFLFVDVLKSQPPPVMTQDAS